jgi:hypothetical protein
VVWENIAELTLMSSLHEKEHENKHQGFVYDAGSFLLHTSILINAKADDRVHTFSFIL